MVVSGNDSIEFVVNETAFLCLKQRQKRVESLYNVTVTSDSLEGELRWVKVNGDEKLRMKAKEYITSMGKPECERILEIEQMCCGQLDEASLDDLLFALEQECSANIVPVTKSSIRISGSTVAVARVESYLNNAASNNQNIELELPIKRARLESTSSVDSKDTASLSDDFQAFDQVEDLLVSLRDEEKYSMMSCDPALKENIDPMLQETSEDFAAKLGYSKDLYAQAVKKVGPQADRNELLNELVKIKNSRKELNEDPQKERPDRRRSSCSSMTSSKQLRPIIIDGSNVAMSHGKQKIFSCRGIQIAVEWFIPRGHKLIYVVIPRWRKESPSESNVISDQEVLEMLEDTAQMIYTPSKTLKQKRIACYDDRYILQIACDKDGVVVSNDNFRDLYLEKPEWKKIIEERVLMYSFVDDMFMPPDDPHGRNGPHIDELLSFGSISKTKVCHYGRHCTYGRNCKYGHPERETDSVLRDSPSNAPRPYSEPVPLTICEDTMCDDFKRLSLPDLNRNQPPPIIARTRHTSPQLPPALPSRRPAQPHHAPPLPPRGNNIHRGMRTTTECPYAALPSTLEQAQMMYMARQQQQPRLPPRRNQNYDTLPFPHQVLPIPPHAQHHQYYNLPPPRGTFILNANPNPRRGGPYDNLPPNGRMPVYPPQDHPIYQAQQNFYRSRAPPTDDSGDEDMVMVAGDKQSELNARLIESEHLRGIAKQRDFQCCENGTESRMKTMVNVA